jgi:hypothetical protein
VNYCTSSSRTTSLPRIPEADTMQPMDKDDIGSHAWRKRTKEVLAEVYGYELTLREVLIGKRIRSATHQNGPDAIKRWRAAHPLKLVKR